MFLVSSRSSKLSKLSAYIYYYTTTHKPKFHYHPKQHLPIYTPPTSPSNVGLFHQYHSNYRTIYDYNVTISKLGRFGKVDQAKKVFDEMPERDIFSYTSMITVYIKHNKLYNAELLFLAMPDRGVVAESAMISGYAKDGRMVEAQRVFDQMRERNVVSWTSLISGYFRIGCVDVARGLFERMPVKNVVSWTTMVLGYANNGLVDQARAVFEQMPESNVVSWTTMVKAYVDHCRTDEAFELFCEMPERNLYSWNIMIQGLLDDKKVDEAIRLFRSMPSRNAVSWTIMVTGLARNGLIREARECFDQMPKKDIAAWNAMITAYSDEGLMVEASELFSLMSDRNTVTWNALIDGYAKHGVDGEAFNYMVEMFHCSSIKPNETTLTSVLISCDEDTLQLLQAHALVIRLGFVQSTSLMNALVTVYSRTGDVSAARLAFEDIDAKDVISWTAMILAYSIHGFGYHALQAFARMLRSGTKPDEVTFVGILTACSHAGLVKKGQRLFDAMVHAYAVKPNASHYSCLVDILGRAGEIKQATRVVREMPLHERDGVVLGALLGACKLHGNVELANDIGEELIELEPNESGGYVALSNVYAACGKWDDFASLRKKMKDRRITKFPGFSQINVRGHSHVFLVGDKNHPQFKQIYMMLRDELLPLLQGFDYLGCEQSVLLSF